MPNRITQISDNTWIDVASVVAVQSTSNSVSVCKEEIKVEPLQILKAADEPNDRQNNTVHVLTVEDIEDIGNRASSLGKVYGFSLKQSLIAATKLKAEEINRDLSVILETCNGE